MIATDAAAYHELMGSACKILSAERVNYSLVLLGWLTSIEGWTLHWGAGNPK
jgi:hypothetical protein